MADDGDLVTLIKKRRDLPGTELFIDYFVGFPLVFL